MSCFRCATQHTAHVQLANGCEMSGQSAFMKVGLVGDYSLVRFASIDSVNSAHIFARKQ